jgi:transposase
MNAVPASSAKCSHRLIQVSQLEAAELLKIGERTFRRWCQRYEEDISAAVSGYLGSSSDEFDTAMDKFVLACADQAERDHAALKAAVRKGKIAASRGS